jgi:uncharacterized hydrophobic protein (TIGR00271 family)
LDGIYKKEDKGNKITPKNEGNMTNFGLIRKILDFINLESELDDVDKIHESITKDIVFKGTNLWILVFAIIVASVGLNINSTAVIIGAMLISPLMGPINGIGYSIATYNFDLFRQSLKNLIFAVLVSLLASTAYFTLSPISTAHSELLARTSPTIYDVLIALFGGLAGIVATSSKQKGNVLPGVAIATALMPPLCTAGYGLATAQFDYFLGAFYLFTINAVFIALASVAISQLLKFPIRTLVDAAQKKRVNQAITIVILIVLLPSIYFGYGLVQKEQFNENALKYISNVSSFQGNFLLKHEINRTKKEITLVYGGMEMTEAQKNDVIDKAKDFELSNAKIIINQGLAIENSGEQALTAQLKEDIRFLESQLKSKDIQFDSIEQQRQLGKIILSEIQTLFPQITACSYAETYTFKDTKKPATKNAIIILEQGKQKITEPEKRKIENWLKARIRQENLNVYYN